MELVLEEWFDLGGGPASGVNSPLSIIARYSRCPLGNAKSEAQTAQEELKAKVELIFSFASFNMS